MKRLIKNFVKVTYTYEKTKIKNNRLNLLASFCFKNKTVFANNNIQLCLIKNKILPFFENLSNKKQIRPLFYSNNIKNFETLKTIARNCGGVVLAGKWNCGFINKKKELKLIGKSKNHFSNQSLTMLIAPNSYFCRPAIREANFFQITSFGSINFGDPAITNVTYFIIGSKNNLRFSVKFCLLLSYLIKWKMHINLDVKKQQSYNYLFHNKYIQKIKESKKLRDIIANTNSDIVFQNKQDENNDKIFEAIKKKTFTQKNSAKFVENKQIK